MNKIHKAVLFAALAFAASASAADSGGKEGIRFGARAGISLVAPSMFIYSDADEESGFGFGVGGFALIPAKFFQFAPGLSIHYRSLGTFSYERKGEVTSEKETLSLSEVGIDIPLMLRLPLWKFYLEAGPQIGFAFSSAWELEYKYKMMGYGPERTESGDVANRFFEYGLALGAGCRIIDNLSVDLRLYASFDKSAYLIKEEDYKALNTRYYLLSKDNGELLELLYVQIGVSYIF